MGRYAEYPEHLFRPSDGDLSMGLFHEPGILIQRMPLWKERPDSVELKRYSS